MAVSEKQLLANKKNALKSTGPVTDPGKTVVSRNAVRHGLRAQQIVIEGESQEEFDDFRDLLINRLSPADPLEMLLADRIAAGFWRLRRAGQIEAQIYDQMCDSLHIERRKDPANLLSLTFSDIDMSFPSCSPFKTFQEAKAAWDVTDDGIACAEGRLPESSSCSDSFSKFLEDSRTPEPEFPETQHTNLIDAISVMIEDHKNRPDFVAKLSELRDTLKSMPQHIRPIHIPAFRQYLQDLRELFHTSDNFNADLSDLDDGIEYISQIEMAMNRQLRPNLGQALSRDLKGPDVFTKFMRYESQIQRSLFKAMHELQRLQSIRQGSRTTAPVAVDIDISSP